MTHAHDGTEPPVSWSDEMTWQEDDYLIEEAKRYEHRPAVAWALLALGGWAALHRLYLGRPSPGLLLGPALVALAAAGRAPRPLRLLAAALLALAWLVEVAAMPRLLREDVARAEQRAQATQDAYRAGQERERAEDAHSSAHHPVS